MLYISNFVLDLINLKFKTMKKTTIVFTVTGLILLATIIWLINSFNKLNFMDLIELSFILIILFITILYGIKRIKRVNKGEVTEDELSKKILNKAAALSYYISLYIWVILIYLKDNIKIDLDNLLKIGILSMVITFGISWLFYLLKGVKND